jgi:hypothetical protein
MELGVNIGVEILARLKKVSFPMKRGQYQFYLHTYTREKTLKLNSRRENR